MMARVFRKPVGKGGKLQAWTGDVRPEAFWSELQDTWGMINSCVETMTQQEIIPGNDPADVPRVKEAIRACKAAAAALQNVFMSEADR